MRKESRPELMLFLVSTAVLWLEAKINITIHIPSQKLPWDEARAYCQKNYINMVTWDIIDKDVLTKWLREIRLPEVWIGLYEDPEQKFVWRWINVKWVSIRGNYNEIKFAYDKCSWSRSYYFCVCFRTGEGLTGKDVYDSDSGPLGYLSGSCGSYNSVKETWKRTFCSQRLPFVCYADNLVLVKQNKTWEEALNHCKEMTNESYKYDLLSFTNSSEYGYVSDRIYRASTDEVWNFLYTTAAFPCGHFDSVQNLPCVYQVWTGLRFLGGEWWWSDGETLDHQEMLPNCPSRWRHCGTVSKNATTDWTTRDCSEKRNFICSYEEVAEQ